MKHKIKARPIFEKTSTFEVRKPYDESYEVELDTGEFLGQVGMVIPEKLSKPYAIEVWSFDMDTSQHGIKVFATTYALTEKHHVQQLKQLVNNPDTDLIQATDLATMVIDSGTLVLQAILDNVVIKNEGFFTAFDIQIRVWQRSELLPEDLGEMDLPLVPSQDPECSFWMWIMIAIVGVSLAGILSVFLDMM